MTIKSNEAVKPNKKTGRRLCWTVTKNQPFEDVRGTRWMQAPLASDGKLIYAIVQFREASGPPTANVLEIYEFENEKTLTYVREVPLLSENR